MDIEQELVSLAENATDEIPFTLTTPEMAEEIGRLVEPNRSILKPKSKSSKVYVVNIQGPGISKCGGSRLTFNGLNIDSKKSASVRPLAPKPQHAIHPTEETKVDKINSFPTPKKNSVNFPDVVLFTPSLPTTSQNGPNMKGKLPKACITSVFTSLDKKVPCSFEFLGSVFKPTEGGNVPAPNSSDSSDGNAQSAISKMFAPNIPSLIENETTKLTANELLNFSNGKLGKTHDKESAATKIIIPQAPNGQMEIKERQVDSEQSDVPQLAPFDPILVSQALIAANRKKRPNIIKSKFQKEKSWTNKVPPLIYKYGKMPHLIELDRSELERVKRPQSLDLSICLKEAVDSFTPKESPKALLEIDADEVTLMKVNGTSGNDRKVLVIPDDDVHIEIIPAKSDCTETVSAAKPVDIDPLKVLDWDADGVGILPGSDFKFRMNEFGMMELVDNEDSDKPAMKNESNEALTNGNSSVEDNDVLKQVKGNDNKNVDVGNIMEAVHIKNNNKVEDDIEVKDVEAVTNNDQEKTVKSKNGIGDNTVEKNNEREALVNKVAKIHIPPVDKLKASSEAPKEKVESISHQPSDDIYYCQGCGCYGLASEFVSHGSCSTACDIIIKQKEQARVDLRKLSKMKRLKRKHDSTKQSSKHTDLITKDEIPLYSDAAKSAQGWHKLSSGKVRMPWQFGSKGFSWPKYLSYHKAKAAPRKLFKSPFPYSKNNFRVGMKMEGIDPEHAALFCVLTVFDVIGYRIKLHFDGYGNNYDFWLSANSMDIFPPGWCDKTNRTLQPPRGYTQEDFNWTKYLKRTKGSPAAKTLFYNKDVPAVISGGFRIGMKLEAVDRQNTNLVCVATVADMIGTRILVHFDGWDDIYDYWAEPTSSYIHPVGWCEKYKHPLSPPNNYLGENFSWDQYLKATKSSAAPARAFKPALGTFRRGMRLECVDKRAPWRVRVATVDDIREHEIRIKFDGWSDMYSYWIDRDSPDIFPMSWCHTTGHLLQIPPVEKEAECPTHDCGGQGHALEAEVSEKHTVPDCPYDPDNLKIKVELDDRLVSKSHEENGENLPTRSNFSEDVEASKPKWRPLLPMPSLEISPSPTADTKTLSGRPSKKARLDDRCELRSNDADWLPRDEENRERRRKKKALKQAAIAKRNFMLDQVRSELHKAVMDPGYDPKEDESAPILWSKHSAPLNAFVQAASQTDLRVWDLELVYRFVSSIPGCKPHARYFVDNFIDGEALSMITQQDLVEQVGLKLGPAIKLYNSVVLLREKIKKDGN